jgi:iron complex outermembrane receptor protein
LRPTPRWTQRTDNYRDNNDFKQTNFSGGAQWFANQFDRIGFRYEGARQDMRFAGSLKEAEFNANPRQTKTPNDNGSLDSDRLTVFGQYRVAGHDSPPTCRTARRRWNRLTTTAPVPQHLRKQDLAVLAARAQAGRHQRHGQRTGGRRRLHQVGAHPVAGYSNADANQKSKALYLRDELRFDAAHEGRISAGVRREIFDKDFATRGCSSPLQRGARPECVGAASQLYAGRQPDRVRQAGPELPRGQRG